MKLYFMPGACSLAIHITLNELGMKYDLERVVFTDKDSMQKFLKVNPKGYVPTLALDDGQIMAEASVILQYLADQKPELNLIPKAGSKERYKCQEWLNYIATELHKNYSPLFKFGKQLNEETKSLFVKELDTKCAWLNEHFSKNKFFMGNQFTVADIYGFVVLGWSKWVKLDLSPYKNLLAFMEQVQSRPSTRQAMQKEGLY